jgi:hypothetical protein
VKIISRMAYDKKLASRIRERLADIPVIEEKDMRTSTEFEYWIQLALEFNNKAKSSRKKIYSGVRLPQKTGRYRKALRVGQINNY